MEDHALGEHDEASAGCGCGGHEGHASGGGHACGGHGYESAGCRCGGHGAEERGHAHTGGHCGRCREHGEEHEVPATD